VVVFVNRTRELADLERFWASERAQCISVVGRRRVGKTYLLERFAEGKQTVYYRCQLRGTADQLPLLGAALADIADDPVNRAQPPSVWPAIFALIERLTTRGRLLLVLDEIPYWVAHDESVPSVMQNWWDARGRHLDLMVVLCGSAVQMMERLLTGDAPLAGCLTGRLHVRPFDFRAAAHLLGVTDPITALTSYGILGGVPLYLTFFRADQDLHENILRAIASSTARLYIEPTAVFAAYHASYNADQALGVLHAIARGKHQWSDIIDSTRLTAAQLTRVMAPLIGDLGLIERVLPVTERHASRAYHTQYHLTDNFFRFWFRFIEPDQGHIEFGDAERVVDGILVSLSDYMGLPFEAMCREWVRLASAAGVLAERVGAVGTWWSANDEVDVVGLDARRHVALTGECKWRNEGFTWNDLQTYLGHVQALATATTILPDAYHLLFSKTGFDARVQRWAAGTRARLLEPHDLLAPF